MMHLSDAMLDQLVDEVDGVNHVALILLAEKPDGDLDPCGIARMVRYDEMPDVADLAVTVRDDWQGHGVATALLDVLIKHRPDGVTHVLTSVFTENPASLAMLSRLGPSRIQDNGHGILDVAIDLDGRGPHPDIVEGNLRLNPVLEEPFREHLRVRDLICARLNPEVFTNPCGRSPQHAPAPNGPAST